MGAATQIIKAEGLSWPLDAFIDAHRFVRTDGEVPPVALASFSPGFRCNVVTMDGHLMRERYAAELEWRDVLAIAPIEVAMDLGLCDFCGELAEVTRTSAVVDGQAALILTTHCQCCCDDEGGSR